MRRKSLHRAVPVLGISVIGAGLGLGVTACSPFSTGASPAAATHAATRTAAPVAAPLARARTAASRPAPSPSSSAPPAAPAAPAASSVAAASASSAAAEPVAPPRSRAPFSTGTYVLWNCAGKAVIEPSDYVVTCADYGMQLEAMHWSSWRAHHAAGRGTVSENDCQPNCAEGKFIDYPADVTLTGSRWWPREGRYSYTAITVHYPDAAPAVYTMVNGKIVVTHPHTFTWPPSGVPAG